MNKKPLILASRSPWRKRLLKKHGIKCHIHTSDFCEKKSGENIRSIVLWNACGKAANVGRYYRKAIIIGVDTLGVFRNKILGKPKSKKAARRMLRMLSGKTHRVISGLCVLDVWNGKKYTAAVTTKITFRKIYAAELESYLDSGQWKGKAGSYAIQGRAKKFVKRIEGDIKNVVGVSVRELKKILKKL